MVIDQALTVLEPKIINRNKYGQLVPGHRCGGAPYKYSPESLQQGIDDFFDSCNKENKTPTWSSLAVYLGTTRETLREYLNNPLFVDILKNAREKTWAKMEEKALANKNNPIFTMFIGKTHYGMVETSHHTTENKNINVNVTVTPEELKKQNKYMDVISALSDSE